MDRLFWVDMEMTGLDPETCVIIEIAVIVTDLDLRPVDSFEAVVAQPEALLDGMDEWNTRTHTETGLVERVKTSGVSLAHVESDLVEFARRHFGDEPIVLCGNSVHQDRRFAELYMPAFTELLHYRVVDVSSFKEVLSRKWGVTFDKRSTHRALDDIQESIAELAYYLTLFTPPSAAESAD